MLGANEELADPKVGTKFTHKIRSKRGMTIFLIGFMGCGKSTVGRKLATAVGYDFVDLDQRVCEIAGMTIPEIFALHGEEAFRRIERQALEEMANRSDVVVATGGGAPCYGDNMDFIVSHGKAVYLKMTPPALQQRLLHAKAVRPKIVGKGPEELLAYIEELLAEREPFYGRANIVVNCNDVTPGEVVGRLKYLAKSTKR